MLPTRYAARAVGAVELAPSARTSAGTCSSAGHGARHLCGGYPGAQPNARRGMPILTDTLAAPAVRLDEQTVATMRPARAEWGSDVVVDMLRMLGVEYVALNPGASFRGL